MTTHTGFAKHDDEQHVSFEGEFIRKGIHLTSLSIPIVYYFITRDLALTILIPMTAAALIIDVVKYYSAPAFELYNRLFGSILRKHERGQHVRTLNGATWVLISATTCVLLFPKLITITAFAILIISDTSAALIGRRFGTKKYRGKTLEGSSAFVVSAFIVILFTPKVQYLAVEYVIAMVAAVFGAIAEVFSFDIIDDNFAIPVSIGFVLWALYALVLPALNVHVLDIL